MTTCLSWPSRSPARRPKRSAMLARELKRSDRRIALRAPRRGAVPQHRRRSWTPTERCSASTARCTFRTTRSTTKNFISLRAIWAFPISTRAYGRIGVLVCWDQWYPEGARLASLRGANILFYPTAIGWHPVGEAGIRRGATRCLANHSALARHRQRNLCRRGQSRGFRGHRRKAASNSGALVRRRSVWPQVLAEGSADQEEILIVECDPRRMEEVRRNWPFLRDRRIDAYAPMLERWLE